MNQQANKVWSSLAHPALVALSLCGACSSFGNPYSAACEPDTSGIPREPTPSDIDGDCWDDIAEMNCLSDLSRNPSLFPGGPEIPANGFDDNCNGLIDECIKGGDCDGDGVTEAEGDCNDQDPNIRPIEPQLLLPNAVGCVNGKLELKLDTFGCGEPLIIPMLTGFPSAHVDPTFGFKVIKANNGYTLEMQCASPDATDLTNMQWRIAILPRPVNGASEFASKSFVYQAPAECSPSGLSYPDTSTFPFMLRFPTVLGWESTSISSDNQWFIERSSPQVWTSGGGTLETALFSLGFKDNRVSQRDLGCVADGIFTLEKPNFDKNPKGTTYVPLVSVYGYRDTTLMTDVLPATCMTNAVEQNRFVVEIEDELDKPFVRVDVEATSNTHACVFGAVLAFP